LTGRAGIGGRGKGAFVSPFIPRSVGDQSPHGIAVQAPRGTIVDILHASIAAEFGIAATAVPAPDCGRAIVFWIISSETTYNVRVFYPTPLCPRLPAISRKHGLFFSVMVECFAPAKPCASGSILARSTNCAIPENFSLLAEDYTGWQKLLLSLIQNG
jgi:hypothetical protein